MGLLGRVGKGAVSSNVGLIEFFEPDDTPSHLAALCSEEGCENLARGIRNRDVPVCFAHGATGEPKDGR